MLDADLRIELSRRGPADREAFPTTKIDAAMVDVLVPLRNRRAFDDELRSFVESARTAGEELALIWFDVDHFKSINDDHGGHDTGDEALSAIADIAQACVKGKGTAYRVGGDEFALVLPNYSEPEAVVISERLRIAVNRQPLTSRSLPVSLSIGVAMFPTHATDFAGLKTAADTAAYDAKDRGRDLVRIFGEATPTQKSREPERKEAQDNLHTVTRTLSPEAILALNWYGRLQREHIANSLHAGNLGPHFDGADGRSRFDAATRELRDRKLLWTDYAPGAVAGGDAFGMHATDLGWAVIENMWPNLRRSTGNP